MEDGSDRECLYSQELTMKNENYTPSKRVPRFYKNNNGLLLMT